MIDISGSVAKHTVTFDRDLTGAQLIAAVQATCERSGEKYHEEKEYDDGWRVTVGRASAQLERSLVVGADKATPFLDPDTTYGSAVIAYYELPDGSRLRPQNYSIENVVDSIKQFGQDLREVAEADREPGLDRSRDPIAPAAGAVASRPAETAAEASRAPAHEKPAGVVRNW